MRWLSALSLAGLLMVCAAAIASPAAAAPYRLEPEAHRGRLWMFRKTSGTYLPVLESGWNFNKALYVCNKMGYGPPVDYQTTFLSGQHQLTRDYEADVGSQRYRVRRSFAMTCDDSAPCTAPAFARQASVLDGSQVQAELSCYDQPLPSRIVTRSGDAAKSYGIVQLRHNGQYRSLCAAGFGMEEATVVCNELGFSGGDVYDPSNNPAYNFTDLTDNTAHFGEGGLVKGFLCTGAESSLSMCHHADARAWELVPCRSLAAVVCNVPATSSDVVPTSGPAISSAGQVAAADAFSIHPALTSGDLWQKAAATYYPVDGTAWDFNKALHVCKSQKLGPPTNWQSSVASGFNSVRSTRLDYRFGGETFSQRSVVTMTCDTSKPCAMPSNALQANSTASVPHAKVSCYDKPLESRIVTSSGDAHFHYGVVQVQRHNDFQLVCGSGWGATEANVLCRELGFVGGGQPLTAASTFNLTDLPSTVPLFETHGLVAGMMCVGDERRLSMCAHREARAWENVVCQTLAGVVCSRSDTSTGDHLAVTAGTKGAGSAGTGSAGTGSAGTTGDRATTPTAPVSSDIGNSSSGFSADKTLFIAIIAGLAGLLLLLIIVFAVWMGRRRRRRAAKNVREGEQALNGRQPNNAKRLDAMRSRPVPDSPPSGSSEEEGGTTFGRGARTSSAATATTIKTVDADPGKGKAVYDTMDGCCGDGEEVADARYTAGPSRATLAVARAASGEDMGERTYMSIPVGPADDLKPPGSQEDTAM